MQTNAGRHSFKILVAGTVSFVLLFYSFAWAVLRCSHDPDQSDQGIARSIQDTDSDRTTSSPDPVALECVGQNYHTEFIASSSSPFELRRLMLRMTADVGDLPIFQTGSRNEAIELWWGAVFEKPPFFLVPRYLSFSTLRI